MLRSSFGVGVGGSGGSGATVASEDPALAALAARVAAGLRSRVAAVLPRAYSRLPLPRAAALLGFIAEEGGEGAAAAFEALVAGQAGWAVSDDGTALSLPRPVAAAAAAGVGVAPSAASAASAAAAAAALADSEDELAKLSKYVLQLEAGA